MLAAWLYNTRIKLSALSWLPWAVSFALLPPSCRTAAGAAAPRRPAHAGDDGPGRACSASACTSLLALPDLVGDNHNGVRSLPLRIALKIGAAKLLLATVVYLALVSAGLVVAGLTVGLRALSAARQVHGPASDGRRDRAGSPRLWRVNATTLRPGARPGRRRRAPGRAPRSRRAA